MRLIVRSPFGHRPEGIHHPSRSIREFIGKPPLIAERSVGRAGEPLKICDPVISSVSRLLVIHVSGLCVVEGFDGGKPRAVAVATLVRQVATEFLSISLFGCDG